MSINLTDEKSAAVVARIKTEYIESLYKKSFHIDVSRFFEKIDEVLIMKNPSTGLSFYTPRSIAGDGDFYEKLEKLPWYYMKEKWEYDAVRDIIGINKSVLEIGCGDGSFLQKIQADQTKVVGLELNAHATECAQKKKLEVYNETLAGFSARNDTKESYDIICSFQVLEHVADPGTFIEQSVALLKPGGYMIVAVPNNDSYMKYDPFPVMNLPPHHMNIWTEKSLRAIAEIFGLKFDHILFEPLGAYHFRFYFKCMLNAHLPFLAQILGPKIYQRLADAAYFLSWPISHTMIKARSSRIHSHTIIAVFTK
jgi:2-polyprenyl-3-methyl-5-hydroxy-6-metoxy-1,4-benzoquinol methylase